VQLKCFCGYLSNHSGYDEPTPGVDPVKMLISQTYQKFLRRQRSQPMYIPINKGDASEEVQQPYCVQKKEYHGIISVWVCKNCSRYLFTPLNVMHLGKTHIEIEQMEWMNEIEKIISSSVPCPSCGNVIGEYDQQHIKLKNGEYLAVFKILRKVLKRIEVKTESIVNVEKKEP
jgi:hypothetical protein